MILGTPNYMAPEQIKGQKADAPAFDMDVKLAWTQIYNFVAHTA